MANSNINEAVLRGRIRQLQRHNLHGVLATPRDPSQSSEEPISLALNADFRYKGYPNQSFESPREKFSISPSEKIHMQEEASKNYHLPNHFDSKRPKVFDEPLGFQYGSEEAPLSKTQPKPINNPLQSKTSAEWRKFRETQEEVDREIEQFKREKRSRLEAAEEEKKRDLAMLKEYHPWGKPGAGAPKGTNKMQGLHDDSLHNTPREPTTKYKDLLEEYDDFHQQFGRPGAGAPLRTKSGRMITEIKADANIRFQDSDKGKLVYDQEVRYRKPAQEKQKYAKELANQVEMKTRRSQQTRLSELRRELETAQHDPYGKPGAGAPNRTRSGQHQVVGRKITLSPDLYRASLREPSRAHSEDFEFYNPWGKGANHPERDRFGNVQRHRFSDKYEGVYTEDRPPLTPPENSLPVARPGGGAPLKTESGHVQTRLPITMRRNEKGDTVVKENQANTLMQDDPELQVFHPFGKGGAGAPIRDTKGNVITSIYGKMQNEGSEDSAKKRQIVARQYLAELEREMDEQKRTKEAMKSLSKAEAGELAGILKEGKVGKPRRDPDSGALTDQHLGTTDVTKERTDTRVLKTEDSVTYHTELERAATERKRIHQLDKLKEKQESKQHQQVFSSMWGRPGAGAPNSHNHQYANFDTILNTPRTKPDDYYNKTYEEGQSKPQNYVRSTVPSKAKNLYEFNKPQKREPKKEYNLLTPWASEPGEVF